MSTEADLQTALNAVQADFDAFKAHVSNSLNQLQAAVKSLQTQNSPVTVQQLEAFAYLVQAVGAPIQLN